ncbi:MAG TPA: methyltransferase domain-containing protein [Mycobacterium sp.]|nr:methyltransferase domain-containing protein [Mycobacterium sp.]
MTSIRQRLYSTIAGQLGRPHGLVGRAVARMLNRGNKPAIEAAVESIDVEPGAVAADIGFGGGAGLHLLLDAVGERGVVHGVEIADDMLARARSTFRREVEAGRLQLSQGSLTALPLDDHVLDKTISVNTIYFVADLDAAFNELARVARPGGLVAIGFGDPDVMRRMPFTSYGFTLRTVDEVTAALVKAGFQVVKQRRLAAGPIPVNIVVAQAADFSP